MLRTTLFALTTTLLVAQTPVEATDKAQEKPAVATPEAETPKADAPKVDKVMACMGERVFRESDFERFLEMALNPQQRMQVNMFPEARNHYRKQFMEFMVMDAKARKDGLDKTEDAQNKLKLMEVQVMVQQLMERESEGLQKKMEVNDEAVKAYYEAHKNDFMAKGSFDARHILIGVEKENPEKSEEAAQAKIAKIKEALKAGKKLEELSKEYNDDPGSKEKGGLYQNITYGSFVPEFDEAVRKQEIGKVGEPIKSQYGYHFIQVEKRQDAVLQEFDKVKDQVKQKATKAKQEEVFQGFMNDLKKEMAFVEDPKQLEAIEKTLPKAEAKKEAPKGSKTAKPAPKVAAKGKK